MPELWKTLSLKRRELETLETQLQHLASNIENMVHDGTHASASSFVAQQNTRTARIDSLKREIVAIESEVASTPQAAASLSKGLHLLSARHRGLYFA